MIGKITSGSKVESTRATELKRGRRVIAAAGFWFKLGRFRYQG